MPPLSPVAVPPMEYDAGDPEGLEELLPALEELLPALGELLPGLEESPPPPQPPRRAKSNAVLRMLSKGVIFCCDIFIPSSARSDGAS